jgi:hypothetical protein
MTLCNHRYHWRTLAIVLMIIVGVWLSLNPNVTDERLRQHPVLHASTALHHEHPIIRSIDCDLAPQDDNNDAGRESILAEDEARKEAQAVTDILRELKSRSAEDAAHWMDKADLGASHRARVQGVALAWSADDLEAELRWAASISDPEDRAIAIEAGLRSLQSTDPERATQAALGAKLDPRVTADLTLQWAWRDLAAARAWVERQPAGESRDEMSASIALVLGATDPAQAADAVASGIPPGPLQEQAAFGVLQNWISSDPDGARAWVDLFPEGELKTRAESEFATGVAASQ